MSAQVNDLGSSGVKSRSLTQDVDIAPRPRTTAAEAINFKVENNYRTQYTPQTDSPVKLIDCNVFKTKIYELTKPYDADYSSTDSFVIYVAFGGNATLTDDRGNTVALSMGESILIPAETDRIKITPQGENFKFLETHL